MGNVYPNSQSRDQRPQHKSSCCSDSTSHADGGLETTTLHRAEKAQQCTHSPSPGLLVAGISLTAPSVRPASYCGAQTGLVVCSSPTLSFCCHMSHFRALSVLHDATCHRRSRGHTERGTRCGAREKECALALLNVACLQHGFSPALVYPTLAGMPP